MATSVLSPYTSSTIHVSTKSDHRSHPKSSFSTQTKHRPSHNKFTVYSVTKGSAEPSKSEETMPSWAKPGSDEPPPWARGDGLNDASQGDGGTPAEAPYIVYLLSSAVAAIAAIGSIFEYANQRPAFGVVYPDSVFYAPLLGFFALAGFPVCAFLWFKAVRVANKESEEQDRRDGYL